MARVFARIDGHVQGVGFRFFVHDRAEDLKVTGWVRNTFDGLVEVTAEGDRDQLEILLDVCRRGPRSAFVTDIQIEWSEYHGEFTAFEIAHTA